MVCSKSRTCTSPLPRPSLDEKTRSITVPVVPASRSEGALRQGKAHWLDLPLQPLPPCIKRRAVYSVLLTERLYRPPTLLLTGNQLAPVLPSLRHPLLVAHATTMRPSTPCGLVVFIGCLRKISASRVSARHVFPIAAAGSTRKTGCLLAVEDGQLGQAGGGSGGLLVIGNSLPGLGYRRILFSKSVRPKAPVNGLLVRFQNVLAQAKTSVKKRPVIRVRSVEILIQA